MWGSSVKGALETVRFCVAGSCVAFIFLFIKLATKRNLLVNPIAAGSL